MTRLLVSVLVVLGGCNGAKPEAKAASAGEAEARAAADAKALAQAQGDAEAKRSASMQQAREAKAAEERARAEAPAAVAPAAVAPAVVAPAVALEPFEGKDGRWGYRTAAGEVVIAAELTMAMPFVDSVAAVVSDRGWVFIDRTGKPLATAFVFDNAADEFVEQRARIVDGDRYGFIASTGEIVVPPTWAFVEPFSGGYAAVCEGCKREELGEHFSMTGGKWGYVDAAGKLVIPPRFEAAAPFVDGRATVKEGGRERVIGPDGAEPK